MTRFFVWLNRYFGEHRALMYSLLVGSSILMALSLMRLTLDEDITSFFPDSEDGSDVTEVFDNLKISDKFILMLSSKNGSMDRYIIEEAADTLVGAILSEDGGRCISSALAGVDEDSAVSSSNFVFDFLPVFLDEPDYQRLDSLSSPGAVQERIISDREILLSPAGEMLKQFVLRDPLGIATGTLTSLSILNAGSDYQIDNGRIYSPDGSMLLCFLTPRFGAGETGRNDALVRTVEKEIKNVSEKYPEVKIEYFAGPAVGVYNARQIKADTFLTMGFALVLIALFIFMIFRRRASVLLVFLPVLWGILFSLCIVSLFKGSISAIAVGTGAVVLGIALSYSIHMIAHQLHVRTVEQLIRELAFPLTVGSLTTIGAFLGLLFTSSSLLRDFGLFASLTLVGTTFFTMVFLPHFLTPMSEEPQLPLLDKIGKINSYGYEKNRALVAVIAIVFIVSVFTSRKVNFNSDMMSINYMPEHLKQSSLALRTASGTESENILFVSKARTLEQAARSYSMAAAVLDSLRDAGLVRDFATAEKFIIPQQIQQERIARWNAYWKESRKDFFLSEIARTAEEVGFREGAFDAFKQILSKEYSPLDYATCREPLLEEYVSSTQAGIMLVNNVSLDADSKEEVYSCFDSSGTVIFDRSWFASRAVRGISDDLDLILLISSIIVFIGLCISYRRLELALLSFLPMLMTWVIIVGLMGIMGMEFNIVNIIICTFIFGIGDDFSIFITDGLTRKYSTGKDVLSSHRTAIFFSAFTIVAGMGAMIAARHPALHSVGAISLVGMLAVLVIAYTLQPLLFRIFVTSQVGKGRQPFTFSSIAMSFLLWSEFVLACVITVLSIPAVLPLPVSKLRKQLWVRKIAYSLCRPIVMTAPVAPGVLRNPHGEDFSSPAVVVSNHQSFLDVLWMLALNPKLLIVAKGWVRKVPVFYPVAKFLGFYYSDTGYEAILEQYSARVKDGWSLAVFPEGTRGMDFQVHRFHKGAFYIASNLGLDIVPVVFYGCGHVFPKGSPMNMSKGVSVAEILPRIAAAGEDYRALARQTRALVQQAYRRLEKEYATLDNPYYACTIKRSMIYKGVEAERSTERILADRERLSALLEEVPSSGRILHRGCGMGQVDFLLKMLSPGREIVAVDSDEENIEIARGNVLCTQGLEFVCADPSAWPSEGFDYIIEQD